MSITRKVKELLSDNDSSTQRVDEVTQRAEEVMPHPIPGHDGYYASRQGVIYKLTARGLKIQRQNLNNAGYMHVSIDGKPHSVHSLIYKTFVGPLKKGYNINHIDFCRVNNHPDNLEQCTPKENKAHSMRAGRHNRGERQGKAKLKEQDIVRIFVHRSNGMRNKDIAKEMGVHPTNICAILQRRTWSHVDIPTYLLSQD